MAKRKKKIDKIGKNDITESTLYRAMMKRKYQQSQNVGATTNPWNISAGGGGYSDPSGVAYNADGTINNSMSAENFSNLSGDTSATGDTPGGDPGIGAGGQLAGELVTELSPPGDRGRVGAGKAAGSILAKTAAGFSTGASIGAIGGAGFLSAPASIIGGIVGGVVGLGTGIAGVVNKNKQGKKAYEQRVGAYAQQKQAIESQQEEKKQNTIDMALRNSVADQQEYTDYNMYGNNPFPGTEMPTLMGQEGKYESSGRVGALLNHKAEMEKSNNDLRSNIRNFTKSLSTSSGGGINVRKDIMGNPYGSGIGGGATVNAGSIGLGIGGGFSPQFSPRGLEGIDYGGGANVTYNPNRNIQLRAGVGTGGFVSPRGASTPQLRPNVGLTARFEKGGNVSHHRGHLIGKDGRCMTCPQGYEAGGNIEDEYTDLLNNVAQGYIPNKKRQKENQFAQQLGPNREITEPGVYQVNGNPHEEGGTHETVPTLKGQETAEFDDKEFLETTVAAGGMETFAFNNHEGDKDADQFASIQKELDKVQKELELIGEMNPEYLEEIKNALA